MDERALFGLVGIVLGIALTLLKEWWFDKKKEQKEREYLSVRVSCLLDRFAVDSADVTYDDGTYHGQYGPDGVAKPQVNLPKIDLESEEVDWKSLPTELMYDVLKFPNKIEAAKKYIDAVAENEYDPPDFPSFFEARQYEYAVLGLEAINLSKRLRLLCKLPEPDEPEWSPFRIMSDKKIEILAERKLREEQLKATLKSIAPIE